MGHRHPCRLQLQLDNGPRHGHGQWTWYLEAARAQDVTMALGDSAGHPDRHGISGGIALEHTHDPRW